MIPTSKASLEAFIKLLLPVTDRHASIKKLTFRTAKSPWIDDELKNCMAVTPWP